MSFVRGIHHVQIAAPAGCEAEARAFYGRLLRLRELPKPAHLLARGGVWFRCGALDLHVGVDPEFRPSRKAHVALEMDDLELVRSLLHSAGVATRDEEPLPGYRRCYVDDPFGNRLELLEAVREARARPAPTIRRPSRSDVVPCAEIALAAFAEVQARHGFAATSSLKHWFDLLDRLVDHPGVHGVVAEREGAVVGAAFMYEHDPVRSIGTVVVRPEEQGSGVGRAMMLALGARAEGAVGVRLVQAAYNTASLGLYAELGFEVKEPLALVSGRFRTPAPPDPGVREMRQEDLPRAAALCARVLGHARTGDLRDALETIGTAAVLERDGRIVAYASGRYLADSVHGVAEAEADLRTLLLSTAGSRQDVSFVLPLRQASLLRWCLAEGLRVGAPLSLMAMGDYREPDGAWFPSIWG